jgi:TonB-linked SusC/RagA family outer membrane protein
MNNINKLKKWSAFILSMLLYMIFLNVDINAQNINVKGKVIDQDGNALPGTAIVVQGSSLGTATNDDGDYVLNNVPKGSILEFVLVGFVKQEIKLTGDKTTINVILAEEAQALDDVTIVAFGQQKKSSVIASVESVNVANLKQPASNLTSAFAGKIPGIISYQTSGEPGADNAQFFVRGVTTFGYKAEPLILIDGFEASSDDLARTQPDDIESFSILKDASATSLYGPRGANGIILINTKSGQEGNVKLNVRIDTHIASPTRKNEFVDGVEYMKLYNEAYRTRLNHVAPNTLGTFYSEQKILSTENGENPMIYPNIDWYEQLFNKQTVNTKANINVSGGGKVATYYVAGGYDKETGLLKVDSRNNFNNNIDINRAHIRTNVIFKLTKTTTLDTRIQGRFERYTGPYVSATDIFRMVMDSNPVDFPAVYEPDFLHQYTPHTLFGSAFYNGAIRPNAYAEMVRGYESRDESTINVQVSLIQDLSFITQGLNAQAKISANTWSHYRGKRTYRPFYYELESYDQITGEYKLYDMNPNDGNARLGEVEANRDASGHYYYELRLNWDRKFGKHNVGLMTVGMMEEKVLTAGNSRSIFETLPERNLGNSGRATYNFDERYFLEIAYGYNGSEKFAKQYRFGFFPSFGAGWLVSNEPFWANLKETVSNLKLKFTYGKVGNDAIAGRSGRFYYLSNISIGSGGGATWGETFTNAYGGYNVSRYDNPDITWEISTKYNLGLELGLFKNEALKIQFDVYRDIRDKIYIERKSLPATSGLPTVSGNLGKVKSQGIDASVDYQHFFNKDFWLTGRGNFTYSVNEYLRLDEKNYTDKYLSHIGQNVNQGYGLVAERLFLDDAEVRNSPAQGFGEYLAGDIKYKDINGDGKIDSNDAVPMGFPTVPEIQYGFGLSAGYKNFDFSFFFQGNARVSFFIDSKDTRQENGSWKYGIAPFSGRRNALKIVADDYWTETNPNVHAFWPRLSTTLLNNNTQQSSWWLRDGSFMRLKSIEAGYSFTNLKKLKIQNFRIYLSAENLFVLSAFKMWDPEMGSNGLGYPVNRRLNIGVQLSF